MTDLLRAMTLLFVLLFLFAGSAAAHKINVFAYAESGEIRSESYFADGRPVKQSRVMVYDSSGKLLFEGKTDDEGLFSFPIPKVDELKIVVREILGHRNSYVLEKPEIEAALEQIRGQD